MTLYGYARVSVREPEDKNLDLQVERLVRAGCSLGNIRAEEASGARNDRGGLLELLDLVVEGDTLVVTHIDRLSRGLTHGLQAIEGLHRAGVEFRSLSEDFDTATATGKLQLTMVLAFSEWWRNSIRERSVAGQAKARAEGRFPGRRPSLNERQREYIRAERSKGVSQRDLARANVSLPNMMVAGRWKDPAMPAYYIRKIQAARGAIAEWYAQDPERGRLRVNPLASYGGVPRYTNARFDT